LSKVTFQIALSTFAFELQHYINNGYLTYEKIWEQTCGDKGHKTCILFRPCAQNFGSEFVALRKVL